MLEVFNQYKGLSKNIYILVFARMINAFGYFVFPFMALFMENKINLEPDRIGFMLLIAAGANAAGAIVGGKISDIFGRKKIVIIFSIVNAIIYTIAGFLEPSMITVYLMVASVFFLSISDPAIWAMVMDLTKPEDRQSSMSLIYLGLNVGLALGFMIAGFLFKNHISWLFWGDGITTMISILLIGLFIQETMPDKDQIDEISNSQREFEFGEKGGFFNALLSRPFLLVFGFLSILFSFIYAQNGFLIPLHLEELFPEDPAALFGGIGAVNGIVVVFLTPVLVLITKKIKPAINVAMAGFLYAIGFGMLMFAQSYWFFILSVLIWTLGEIIGGVNTGVYIANHSPITHRGRFQGFFTIIRESGRGLGPFIMGKYLLIYSIESSWAVIFIIGIIAGVGMLKLNKIEANKAIRIAEVEKLDREKYMDV